MNRTRTHLPASGRTAFTFRRRYASRRRPAGAPRRAWLVCLAALAGLSLAAGCGRGGVPPPALSPTPAGGAALRGPGPLSSSVPYQAAVAAYRQRDYRRALALIDGLLAAPAYQDSRPFLRRQRALCLHALDPRSPVNPRPPVDPPVTAAASAAPAPAEPAPADCGPHALLLACRALGVQARLSDLRRWAGGNARGTTLAGLAQAAQSQGLRARGVQVDRSALVQVPCPALAWVDGDHFVAVLAVQEEQATIHDPNKQSEEEITPEELLRRSGGILLTLARSQRVE